MVPLRVRQIAVAIVLLMLTAQAGAQQGPPADLDAFVAAP